MTGGTGSADRKGRGRRLILWRHGQTSWNVERRFQGTTDVELAQLLGLLRTPPDEFAHLMALHRETHIMDWLQPAGSGTTDRVRTLREHERIASEIAGWSMNVVHGLVQVPDYTWHLALAKPLSEPDARAVVENRVVRQTAVLDGQRTVAIYMHEQALRLPVGDSGVMAEQLHHLLRISVRPYVTIRLIPTAFGPHAGLAGDFDRLRFKKIPAIVYVESEGANVFLEDQTSVDRYDTVLESLDRAALDEVQTRKLITEIIGEETRDDQVAQEQLQR